MNVKRTFRNVARLTAPILGNLGAESRLGLLNRFTNPGPYDAEHQRLRSDLYLDVPEEWDGPYRFFRW